jgi:siroheme synthase-like protein
MSEATIDRGNTLFPVFIKLEQLRLLIVGGGKVGLEKLQAVLQNSPATQVTVVAPDISQSVRELAARHPNILLLERPYHRCDLENADIAIVAVGDRAVSEIVARDAKEAGILVNVADTPDLCDFYLSSVIRKGNLKIAISTNGKSPTIAKRLKEELGGMIPDEMESVLNNMQTIRQQLNGDFPQKVRKLNELTKVLVAKQATLAVTPRQNRWQQVVKWCLFAFCFMIIGHGILSYVPFTGLVGFFRSLPERFDVGTFAMMALAGFLAQMVDGSMGLGYGTISTTFLLAWGHINPAIVSSRVHSARVFSSGVSGYSHHRFGNINKKLFRAIVIPGILGAVIGASLAYFGQGSAKYVRIPLSFYTVYLGYYIVRKAFARRNPRGEKVRKAGWLAAAGGLTDAFAGGGWGTLVTSTLISKRRNPRYVIGSVCLAEFFVVLASSITFFILLESIPLMDVAGMIIGGMIAAPIAARLVGKLPVKTMFVAVGSLVILTSCLTLWKSILQVLHH